MCWGLLVSFLSSVSVRNAAGLFSHVMLYHCVVSVYFLHLGSVFCGIALCHCVRVCVLTTAEFFNRRTSRSNTTQATPLRTLKQKSKCEMQGFTTAAFSWTQIVTGGGGAYQTSLISGDSFHTRKQANLELCLMKPKFGSDNLWALNT
jgi:hypothetical protein